MSIKALVIFFIMINDTFNSDEVPLAWSYHYICDISLSLLDCYR